MKGAFTALVTPFDSNARVDDKALAMLVEKQIEGGIAGIVPCGTTGESPTLDDDEHIGVIAKVVKLVGGRTQVVAGTGSNSTREAVNLSKRAVDAGASSIMIVMPYYNKPTQTGLIEHCVQVANAVPSARVVLYNVPGRTASDLLVESVEQVCKRAHNVVAIKEATGNILRAQEIVRRLGDRISVLSGDDALTLGMMACGAKGVISVTSNIYPREVQTVCSLMLSNAFEEARALHLRLLPVHDSMFIESNPGPVKAVLAERGLIGPYVRSPLAWPTDSTLQRLKAVCAHFEGEGK